MSGGKPTDHKCNEDLGLFLLANDDRMENTPENWEKHKEVLVSNEAPDVLT